MNRYKHKTIATALKASVYAEGQCAFKKGQHRAYNPYTGNNLALAAIWWNGWDTGEEESEPIQSARRKSTPPVLIPD
jgi:hypothetical protein